MIRKLLDGRYTNTAFCIFDPLGQRRLSRTGRSPGQGLNTKRGPGKASHETIIQRMTQIASRFTPTGNANESQLQDFDSFRQALNVASADQRLLLYVNADEKSRPQVESALKQVFTDKEILGRFHLDFSDVKTDAEWGKLVKGSDDKPGMNIIRSGQFGVDGELVKQITLTSAAKDIKSSLLAANENFAKVEKRKSYTDHIRQARREGIKFENAIPYGEDRDGDGEIDKRGRRGGGGKGGKGGGGKRGGGDKKGK